jgi:hypothetical protein
MGAVTMDVHDEALVLAGAIGSSVAVFHGVVVQRHIVRPWLRMVGEKKIVPASIVRIVPGLLHYTTLSWFLGGLGLMAAAIWFGKDAKLTTSIFVVISYLYGVLGNLWATRGRHPGWALLAVAVVLIGFSLSGRQV